MDSGSEIRLGDCILHVIGTISASLLPKVIGVICDAATYFREVYIVCNYTDFWPEMDRLTAVN